MFDYLIPPQYLIRVYNTTAGPDDSDDMKTHETETETPEVVELDATTKEVDELNAIEKVSYDDGQTNSIEEENN